jgi:hypothetical protein
LACLSFARDGICSFHRSSSHWLSLSFAKVGIIRFIVLPVIGLLTFDVSRDTNMESVQLIQVLVIPQQRYLGKHGIQTTQRAREEKKDPLILRLRSSMGASFICDSPFLFLLLSDRCDRSSIFNFSKCCQIDPRDFIWSMTNVLVCRHVY